MTCGFAAVNNGKHFINASGRCVVCKEVDDARD